MRALLHRSGGPLSLWAVALPFVTLVLFAGSQDVFWDGDFYLESYPSYLALQHGRFDLFFDLMPGYSGFTVVVGSAAAMLTKWFGGMETMALRISAAPGLLALGAVGVLVAGPVKAAGNRAWPLFVVCAAGGALAFHTTRAGHPEELLATGLLVMAVLAAYDGRIGWSTGLLVAAIASKQWAVLGILPCAMVAPRGGLRIAGIASAFTLVLVGVQTQIGGGAHGTILNTGQLFHPHQVWWPFGVPATREFFEAGHGERMGPEWLSPLVRPIILAAGAAVAIAWWRVSGKERNRNDIFGVLALIFLLRCLLDPWNLAYYHLPFVVMLAVWDARRGRDLPVLSIAGTAMVWLTFITYDEHYGNGPYFAYLAWTLPFAAGLAWTLLRKPAPEKRRETAGVLPATSAA